MEDRKNNGWQQHFFLSLGVILLLSVFVYQVFRKGDPTLFGLFSYRSDAWLAPILPLQDWDAHTYIRIAENGYRQFGPEVAFAPLYPMLVRAVGFLVGHQYRIAEYIISWVTIFVAGGILYNYFKEHAGNKIALRAMQYLFIFPTAFFFFSGYTESLFLLLVVLAWISIEKGNWWRAGIFGFFSVLCRFVGLALVFPYLIAWYKAPKEQKVRSGAAMLLIPLAYMGWNVFAEAQYGIRPSAALFESWPLSVHAPLVGVLGTIEGLINQSTQSSFASILDLIALVIVTAAAYQNIRKRRWKEVVFTIVLVILSTIKIADEGYFVSLSRYLLIIFPTYLGLAELGENKIFHWAWVIISFNLMMFSATLFMIGHWVA